MTRLLWLTDIHLSFLGPGGAKAFGEHVRQNYKADITLVTGDLAEGNDFDTLIEEFAQALDIPTFFVLGNHDVYKTSIAAARTKAAKMKGKALWLTNRQVELSPTAVLIANDGWYDARLGDPKRSCVVMSDFYYIKDLLGKQPAALRVECQEIADEMAAEAEVSLNDAIKAGYKQIVFATHVPPFAGATWHEGAISNRDWLPWMSNSVMGETLAKTARENPDVEFLVLCGHTHSAGTYQHDRNLKVLTGHSEYRNPRVCGEFTFL